MRHPAVPGLTFVTRVGYVPERVSPATPQMTTLAGGVRLALLEIGNLTASTSFELEGMHFSPGAYNRAVGAGFYGRVDHESYYRGWRGGVRFSPAVDLWPTDAMGLRFAPALRWLGPVGHGGPEGDAAYVTFGLGVLLKLRP